MKTKEFLLKLRQYGLENEVPNITDENAEFLTDLIKKNDVRNILEIGTANGYSTICFADILKDVSGHITSIEFSINSHNQAKENIKEVGLEDTCNLLHGQALDIIPTFEDKSFDFVFIDGMKRRSKDFLELSWPKTKDGGMIVIDDVIKFKQKMIGLYEYLEEKGIGYEVLKIDIDDGIMIIRK
ncbi:MAG: class I SAM-dependent methyltransferase [Candidatus Gracilibacteria bacterium]|nr:class I SAM-dependent methyltransferase [Candidatus Gracilibacteria bacterium]